MASKALPSIGVSYLMDFLPLVESCMALRGSKVMFHGTRWMISNNFQVNQCACTPYVVLCEIIAEILENNEPKIPLI